MTAAGSDGNGNNTGLDAITVNGSGEADTTAPQVSNRVPANGAAGIAVDANLVLTFDENVRKGAGDIVIKNSLGNQSVATLDVSSANVVVAGPVVTIDLPGDLAAGTSFHVEMAGGVIEDLSGNAFGGFAGVAGWSFVTAAASPVPTSLIAHYTFDVDNAGNTPDSVGSGNFATLGEPGEYQHDDRKRLCRERRGA